MIGRREKASKNRDAPLPSSSSSSLWPFSPPLRPHLHLRAMALKNENKNKNNLISTSNRTSTSPSSKQPLQQLTLLRRKNTSRRSSTLSGPKHLARRSRTSAGSSGRGCGRRRTGWYEIERKRGWGERKRERGRERGTRQRRGSFFLSFLSLSDPFFPLSPSSLQKKHPRRPRSRP